MWESSLVTQVTNNCTQYLHLEKRKNQFHPSRLIPMTRTWPLYNYNPICMAVTVTPIMHLTLWYFRKNQIRKKKWERNGNAQGKEMNEPHRRGVTNSHLRRDNYPWSWLPLCHLLSEFASTSLSNVTLVFNKSLPLSSIWSYSWILSCMWKRTQSPPVQVESSSWTSPWFSSDTAVKSKGLHR